MVNLTQVPTSLTYQTLIACCSTTSQYYRGREQEGWSEAIGELDQVFCVNAANLQDTFFAPVLGLTVTLELELDRLAALCA